MAFSQVKQVGYAPGYDNTPAKRTDGLWSEASGAA